MSTATNSLVFAAFSVNNVMNICAYAHNLPGFCCPSSTDNQNIMLEPRALQLTTPNYQLHLVVNNIMSICHRPQVHECQSNLHLAWLACNILQTKESNCTSPSAPAFTRRCATPNSFSHSNLICSATSYDFTTRPKVEIISVVL